MVKTEEKKRKREKKHTQNTYTTSFLPRYKICNKLSTLASIICHQHTHTETNERKPNAYYDCSAQCMQLRVHGYVHGYFIFLSQYQECV